MLKRYSFVCARTSTFSNPRFPDDLVDVVITSPPFNIRTPYPDGFVDCVPWAVYWKVARATAGFCRTGLATEGRVIVDVADVVFDGRRAVALARLWEEVFHSRGFTTVGRSLVCPVSAQGRLGGGDLRWKRARWIGTSGFHSPCRHVVVLEPRSTRARRYTRSWPMVDVFLEAEDLCIEDWAWGRCFASWLIERYTKEGETVFDPFPGGDSLSLACKKLGRSYVISEAE